MCVNDLVVQGAEPLFFLDYFATGALDVDAAAAVIEGDRRGLPAWPARRWSAARRPRCRASTGAATTTSPASRSARSSADALLPRGDLAAGDVLLGLASSGLHSNGFSLVRRIVERSRPRLVRPGAVRAGDEPRRGAAEPTRIYVRAVPRRDPRRRGAVKALAHITGGGLLENVPRVLPASLPRRSTSAAIPVPPVFRWLRGARPVAEAEMLRTFNCGIGMVLVGRAGGARASPRRCWRSTARRVVELGRLVPRARRSRSFSGRLDLGG